MREIKPATAAIEAHFNVGIDPEYADRVLGVFPQELRAAMARIIPDRNAAAKERAQPRAATRRAQEETTLRDAEVKAVAALREGEEHYRTLVQNAPEAIVVYAVKKGAFVDCNDKAIRLFGRARDELLSSGPRELRPPHQPDGQPSEAGSCERVARAVEGDAPPFDWVCCNSQGEEFPAEVHPVRLSSAGRPRAR